MAKQSALLLFIMIVFWAYLASQVAGHTEELEFLDLQESCKPWNKTPQLSMRKLHGGDPCQDSWIGVECEGSSIIHLKLHESDLSGNVGYELVNLENVKQLDLSSNNLHDQTSSSLPLNLKNLSLAKYYEIMHSLSSRKLQRPFGLDSGSVIAPSKRRDLRGTYPNSTKPLSNDMERNSKPGEVLNVAVTIILLGLVLLISFGIKKKFYSPEEFRHEKLQLDNKDFVFMLKVDFAILEKKQNKIIELRKQLEELEMTRKAIFDKLGARGRAWAFLIAALPHLLRHNVIGLPIFGCFMSADIISTCFNTFGQMRPTNLSYDVLKMRLRIQQDDLADFLVSINPSSKESPIPRLYEDREVKVQVALFNGLCSPDQSKLREYIMDICIIFGSTLVVVHYGLAGMFQMKDLLIKFVKFRLGLTFQGV